MHGDDKRCGMIREADWEWPKHDNERIDQWEATQNNFLMKKNSKDLRDMSRWHWEAKTTDYDDTEQGINDADENGCCDQKEGEI